MKFIPGPVARIKDAHGDVLFAVDARNQMTIFIDLWENPKIRQYYFVWIRGVFEGGGDTAETRLLFKAGLSRKDTEAQRVEVVVDSIKYETLVKYRKFNVLFGVHPEINNESPEGVIPFKPGFSYWYAANYKDKTSFAGGGREGWLTSPEVDPAAITFEVVEGKTCFHYKAVDGVGRKELLFKELTNLIVGKRYCFTASVYAPGSPRQGEVVLNLEEGKRYADRWNLAYQFQSGFYPIGGGITATSPEVRLSIFRDGLGSPECRELSISDIAVYEFDERRQWDPDWDKEWPKDELPPAKETEGEVSDV